MSEAEASLEIDGVEFRFFSDLEITRAVDAIDTLAFSAPFEPDNKQFRDKFRPGSFRSVTARLNGKKLFDGTMVNVNPSQDDAASTVQVECYSRCGVWEDCTAPIDLLPLQFNGFDLEKIAKKLAEPFGLAPKFIDGPGPVFDKVALEPTDTILSFLAELAKQRGLVIGSNEDGDPVFRKSASASGSSGVLGALAALGSEVVLDGNAQPVLSVTPNTQGRSLFGKITGIAKAKNGREGSRFTSENRFLSGVVRPFTFELDDAEPAEVPVATAAKLGRMFASAASYAVEVATLFDSAGDLWTPNTFVKLTAPRAMIYQPTSFLIRSVTLRPGTGEQTASLGLVLPGAFSGEIPERMPWDE